MERLLEIAGALRASSAQSEAFSWQEAGVEMQMDYERAALHPNLTSKASSNSVSASIQHDLQASLIWVLTLEIIPNTEG